MNRLEFKLNGLKPVSTNEMYSYGRRIVRKSNKYRAFESEVILQIRKESDILISGVIDKFKEELERNYRLAIKGIFKFYIPKRSYFRVDTSNYIKAMEDIIKNLIEIDDSRNVSIIADKYLSSDKEWHIQIELEIFQLSYEIPKNKWSKNILGSNKNPVKKKIKSRITKISKSKNPEKIRLTGNRLAGRNKSTKDNRLIEIEKGIWIKLL